MKHSTTNTEKSPRPSEKGLESRKQPPRESASDELFEDGLENVPLAPEIVRPELANLTAWDESADDAGHRVEPVLPEDETSVAQLFVDEGMSEADDELRSEDEDREQEEEAEDEPHPRQ